jgi:hypothetical protein
MSVSQLKIEIRLFVETQRIIMSQTMNRVEQAVLVGSPFEALSHNFISGPDLLNWLLTAKSSVKNMDCRAVVAYRALCDRVGIKLTVEKDGKQTPFIQAAASMDFKCLYYILVDPDKITDWEEYSRISSVFGVQPDLLHTFQILAGMQVNLNPKTMPIAAQVRHPLISEMKRGEAGWWLDSDWFDRMDTVPFEPMLARCEKLQAEAPDYFREVAGPEYAKRLKKFVVPNLTPEVLLRVQKLGLNLVKAEWMGLSPLARQIMQTTTALQAYLLGFNLHEAPVSEELLMSALHTLSQKGPEAYTADIMQYYKTHIPSIPPCFGQLTLANDKDLVNFEDIFSFSPMDRYYYIHGKHIHAFIRPELENILKDGKNPYTKEPLDKVHMGRIQRQLKAVAAWQLPPCEQMLTLLKKVESKELTLPKAEQKCERKCDCPVHRAGGLGMMHNLMAVGPPTQEPQMVEMDPAAFFMALATLAAATGGP